MFSEHIDDFSSRLFFMTIDRRKDCLTGKVLVDNRWKRFGLSWDLEKVILRIGQVKNPLLLKMIVEKIGKPSVRCFFKGWFSREFLYFWFKEPLLAKKIYKSLCKVDEMRCLKGRKRGYSSPVLLENEE